MQADVTEDVRGMMRRKTKSKMNLRKFQTTIR